MVRETIQILADPGVAWIGGGFRDHLTNWGLHLIRIRLCFLAIEVQIERRLIHAIEILEICGGSHMTLE